MVSSLIYYKFSNANKSLTGNFSFDQAAAVDQQVTLAEGLNISATYTGQTYTQANDALALLLTNSLGEISSQGLGLQFVTNAFTVNAENFFVSAPSSAQTVTYSRIYAPTDLVFNTIYNFTSADKSLTGSIAFNQGTTADQQVTIAEGLKVNFTYNGKTYTQVNDGQALLLTNLLGEIADLGLGLQFVADGFTINADNFVAGNKAQNITYTRVQAPTNSALSAISINENVAAGTVIASFNTTDSDVGNTFIYSLVAGSGDTDNAAFTIDGDQLKINASPNFEAKLSYSIRVRTTDNDGLTFEKPLTITVKDINETPTNLVFNTIYNFNSTDKSLTGSIAFNQGTTADQQVTIAEGLKVNFTYNGKTYTQVNDGQALLLTNLLGEIADLGLGLQFVADGFTINADNFVAGNKAQNITYTRVQAPTNSALSAISINENVAAGTVIASFNTTDPDVGNIFTYSLVAGSGDTDNAAFTIDGDQLKINSSPNFEAKPSYSIRVKTTDQGGLSFDKSLTVNVNNIVIPAQLTKGNNDVFNIKGDNGKGTLKFNIISSTPNANQLNELGVFNVDDAAGTIRDSAGNSLLPGAEGYAKAALARAKILFSTIANLPNGFNNSDVVRSLQLNSDANVRFYLVQGNTTKSVINKGSYGDVVFSATQNIKDSGNGNFSLSFPNLVVNLQATNQPLDSGLSNTSGQQGATNAELLYVTDKVNATFVINREAGYDNFIGFYKVTDETGTININGTVYKPGDSGYTQAAINSRVAGFTGINQATVTAQGKFSPNAIFAPFIIANGDPSTYISRENPVYFSFLGANPNSDKQVNHVRLLGNNTFGFEDLPNGGDQDFNDVIVRVNLS
ncbi:DUF4114 domain-containing protein [Fortiea contorta]|uniref:DUF4114 domain-containing protein n=1 Tax=Fortiea contorta TaxID=1892405 RepID=UPI00034C83EC|nr:DUF4114 domain-containing protein [Fortiea contorta]